MRSVLLVCTANVVRSPMAMALLRAKVVGEPDWRIESAGTWALAGQPAAEKTRIVLANRGLDISDHQARSVDQDMLNSFNLILAMEPNHVEALIAEFPEVAGRIHLVSQMIGLKLGICDPIGGSLLDFEEIAQELERIFDVGLERIRSLAGNSPT
jgi:protein-tyrosine phosphatase